MMRRAAFQVGKDIACGREHAGGRTRTDTRFPSRDFESRASTNFTTPAMVVRLKP